MMARVRYILYCNHQLRTCDGYFPNSLQPLLYLGYIWVFVKKNQQQNDGNHGQGTHSAKMGADSSAKNTPNVPKVIRPICPIGPKVWNIVEKRLH